MPSTYTNLLYRIVFSTKQRQPLICRNFEEELYRYIGGIIRAEGGVQIEIGGIEDHIHILAKFKPAVALSDMLSKIKANSSKWANENHKTSTRFGWQEGFVAFSVSESQVPTVRQYIRNQEQHHQRRNFQDELLAIFERHQVEFDPRYLWD